jgi:hypothetical protein
MGTSNHPSSCVILRASSRNAQRYNGVLHAGWSAQQKKIASNHSTIDEEKIKMLPIARFERAISACLHVELQVQRLNLLAKSAYFRKYVKFSYIYTLQTILLLCYVVVSENRLPLEDRDFMEKYFQST